MAYGPEKELSLAVRDGERLNQHGGGPVVLAQSLHPRPHVSQLQPVHMARRRQVTQHGEDVMRRYSDLPAVKQLDEQLGTVKRAWARSSDPRTRWLASL